MSKFLRKIVLLAFFLAFQVDHARAADFFVVDSIEVKEEEKDSVAAKKNALSKVWRFALQRLLSEQLDIHEELELDETAASECLYDYSIKNEKYSDCFYIAEISCRFDTNRVYSLLEKHDIKILQKKEAQQDHNIKVVIYVHDFIKNYREIEKLNYCVEKFTGLAVMLSIKNAPANTFDNLGIRYANL